MKSSPFTAEVFQARWRTVLGTLILSMTLLLILGAWSLPFLYESSSLWYKFGLHKHLLRTGKMVGLTAATLVSIQVILSSRFHFLDRVFSLNRLFALHRRNGMLIAGLILVHPNLILAAGNYTLFGLEKKYWPEFLGIGLAVTLLSLIAVAVWRPALGLKYSTWRPLHRFSTFFLVMILPVHILFVSDTFRSGPPRVIILALAMFNILLFLRIWCRRLFPRNRRYLISRVAPAGKGAVSIEADIPPDRAVPSLPGQFAFITPISPRVKKEEHPFSIASSPARPETLQFIIRACGDWTDTAGRLQPGDAIILDGPYGLFSHLANPPAAALVMIAGGIGITPLLSMLRYMADTGDRRRVLLIWSNRTREEIIFPDEFRELTRKLPSLEVVHHLSRGTKEKLSPGRLNLQQLQSYLHGRDRKADVYLCGPAGMMKEVKGILRNLGFGTVYSEEFRL